MTIKKISIDSTPLMIKLYEIDAHLITLNKVLLNDEQKEKFNELYPKSLKQVILNFVKDHPDLVEDSDELLRQLSD